MKLRWVVVTLLIFSLGGFIHAQNDDSFNFQELQDGVPFTNVFEGDVNAHLYTFQGSAGDVITISMVQDEGVQLDSYIVLLGSAGKVLANADEGGSIPLAALLENFELPEDGTYFVLATSFDGLRNPALLQDGETEQPMFYEIVVSGITTPDGASDQIEDVTSEIAIGNAANLEITMDELVFYLSFVGSEGDTITINTAHDGSSEEVDTLLYLFDAEGNRIAINDDNDNSFFSTISNVELPADGRYMVFATTYIFYEFPETTDRINVGTFNLSIE